MPPWELAQQPFVWQEIALYAEAVEGEAQEALQQQAQQAAQP